MTTLAPLRNQVFLKRHASPEFIGRIVIPKTATNEKLLWADVVAVGPGKMKPCKACKQQGCADCAGIGWKRKPVVDLAAGDVVIFQLHAEEDVFFTADTLEALGYARKDAGDIISTYEWACIAIVKTIDGKATLVPRGDRVVCKKDAADMMTGGGIIIPDEYRDEVQREKGAWGTVLATGADVVDVRVASRVLLPKHDGTKVKVEGEEYFIHAAGGGGDILAVVEA